MTLAKVSDGQETVLASREVAPPPADAFTLVKFANVDHQLLFEFDGNELSVDLGRSPQSDGTGLRRLLVPRSSAPGKLTLSHVALFRDIHYTGDGQGSRGRPGRRGQAVPAEPG